MRAVSSANSRLLEWLIVKLPRGCACASRGISEANTANARHAKIHPQRAISLPPRLRGLQPVGGFVSVEQGEVRVQVSGLLQVRVGLLFVAKRLRDHAGVEELQRVAGFQPQRF